MAKAKYIKQTVARDNKTGRFIAMRLAAKRSPKTTTISTIRIPVRSEAALA